MLRFFYRFPIICILVGLLLLYALLVLPAYAQEMSSLTPGAFDPMFGLLGQIVGPSAAVFGVVLVARLLAPRWFAPDPSTERSKVLCMTLAMLAGLALGWASVAPGIGQAGLAGRLVGGFLCACLAVFGRDFLVRAKDGLAECKSSSVSPPRGPVAS